MRFASLSAAFILLLLLLTPLKHAVRYLSGQGVAGGLFSGLAHALIIAALWAVLTGTSWALRRWLMFADAWASSGLAGLDRGVHGRWALGWWLFLSLLLVVGSALAGPQERAAAVAEAIAACAFVLVAFLGPPPEANPVDEYDPLPLPAPSPEPIPSIPPAPIPPVPEEVIPLTMWWYFRKDAGNLCAPLVRYEVQVRASKARYEQLRAQDHRVKRVQDYARFVREGLTPEVDETCRQIRQFSEADRLSTVAEINNVLAFAQRFKYAFDRDDKGVPEYPKFPLETMVEDRGDCEDHAILAAACFARLGYEVRLVSVEYGTGPGHMAVAVAGAEELPEAFALQDPVSGRKFYYCEVTTDAASRDPTAVVFRLGETPESEKRARLELIPVA
ncbi:MAG: transglutaminase-like domain-containing protein [Acidobacteriota bacterium]